ncbi:hypothetical protein DV701_11700 [Ornithinimicrobium avium]|uniref:Retropepsin-like aspartic endopeptidase domain-containing protein n=1 Tax=Ornithinimicrobium avium TaxID=2283195 RepID=A0A345NNT7_9MICO|nr:hypothetical protein DV701_11700 [Ornithinimicrobium avium]
MGRVTGQTHETIPAATVVGWREWVRLDALGVPWIKAKIDTGARTSSLHAFDLQALEVDGSPRVRFSIHPWQATAQDEVAVELPVHDVRSVRSSSGHAETRYVVLVPLVLHGRQVEAEVTLTDRDEMGFRMLVGREALVPGFLVDPGLSYAGGRPERAVRRRNWGRTTAPGSRG